MYCEGPKNFFQLKYKRGPTRSMLARKMINMKTAKASDL